jgi:hypothetical protein
MGWLGRYRKARDERGIEPSVRQLEREASKWQA